MIEPSFTRPFSDSLACGVLLSLPCMCVLPCVLVGSGDLTAPMIILFRVSRVPCSSVVHSSRSFSIPCRLSLSPLQECSVLCVGPLSFRKYCYVILLLSLPYPPHSSFSTGSHPHLHFIRRPMSLHLFLTRYVLRSFLPTKFSMSTTLLWNFRIPSDFDS